MARVIHSTVQATMLHSHHLLFNLSPPLLNSVIHRSARSVHILRRLHPSSFPQATTSTPPSELAASPPEPEVEGPIEIPPPPRSTLFATDDNPTPLQVATSLLLTGAISVFLFRSLRRRARRSKELRVRSTGLNDTKQDALESLKAIGEAKIDPGQPPSPAQAFLGSIAAGVLCLILYKFTTTVEASLNRQAISDNFSVRQITITIRTIVKGLCYLATFVFGINSVGLMLYSLQLALGSAFDNSDSNKSDLEKKEGEQLTASEGSMNNVGPAGSDLKQTSDNNSNRNSSQ